MEGLKLKFGWLQVVFAVSVALATAFPSNGDEINRSPLAAPAVYQELQSSPDGTAYVIVMLEKPLLTANATLDTRQQAVKSVQDRVLQNLGPKEFSVVYKYENFAAMTGRVNAAGLARLAVDPHVTAIGPDAAGHACLDDSVPFINADDVHAQVGLGYTGEGITVAVLDTGIDSDHPDLRDDVAPGWYHFLNQGDSNGPGAEDDHGHGTNVAGIITSRGAVAPLGVAPDANILAIKVLDANGDGWVSDWTAGVDYVVSNMHKYDNLCVMNMSLGTCTLFSQCPCDPCGSCDPDNPNTWLACLRDALNAAKNAGIVIFASSGNNGRCNKMPAPACLSAATAVAAVYDQDLGIEPDSGTYYNFFCSESCPCGDCDLCPTCSDVTTYGDLIACFSNRNSCNELAAPGVHITSSYIGGGTDWFTGTSQAAPHCSAVAALMVEKALSLRVWWSPTWLVNTMKDTGVPTVDSCSTSPNPIRVDAFAAVNEFVRRWAGYKYKQLPNTSGYSMDIACDRWDSPGPTVLRILADDFLCTATGPISKVVLYGSWEGDIRVTIGRIHLGIYNDVPDPDGGGPEFSKPGNLLWEGDFYDVNGDITESRYFVIPPMTFPGKAWWWDPAGGYLPVSGDDKETWMYGMLINPTNAFVQQGDPCEPIVYWLGVHVYFSGFIVGDPGFGWKTARLSEGWNDAAVYSNNNGSTWNKLQYPAGHSYQGTNIDFAFKTFGPLCCNCADFDYDSSVDFEDYADFADNWSWTGQSGGGFNDCDLNCDGIIDFRDLRIFARQWLVPCMDDCLDR